MLKKAFDRESKSESGFSFAMASQPFKFEVFLDYALVIIVELLGL